MPVTPNSRCSTIAEAICNLRRNQLDELAFNLIERDADWAEALGKRLTGRVALNLRQEAGGDGIVDAPEGNLVDPAEGEDPFEDAPLAD